MSDGRRPVPPGWTALPEDHAPAPTPVPALFAFGVTLVAWGIVSSFVVGVIGLLVTGGSLVHWIGEIAHDEAQRRPEA